MHFTLGSTPIFWTNKNKNILAAFMDDPDNTIYEFDASTAETAGAPFEGHTDTITGLALSFDGALLASVSYDNTIKLWAFESRQLLASFDIKNVRSVILSPDSRQLAYTTVTRDDHKIYICNTPPDIFASIQSSREAMLQDLTEYIIKDEAYPVARGGFGEMWKCTYKTRQRPIKVRLHVGSIRPSKVHI